MSDLKSEKKKSLLDDRLTQRYLSCEMLVPVVGQDAAGGWGGSGTSCFMVLQTEQVKDPVGLYYRNFRISTLKTSNPIKKERCTLKQSSSFMQVAGVRLCCCSI